jgi:AmmeMemoRadiSam system protein B
MPGQSPWRGIRGGLALTLASLLPCSSNLSLPGDTDTTAVPRTQVRPAAVAGSWYPAEREQLEALLDRLLRAVPVPAETPAPATIRATISPHAGYRYSGATAAAGYARLSGRQLKRVIVIGPAHRFDFDGLSVPSVDSYETPLGRIPLDSNAVAGLLDNPLVHTIDAAHMREHSIEMQLPFLQQVLEPGWQLVPILVGHLHDADYRRAAALLKPLADARTLVVVSSDFSHYGRRFGFQPFPPDTRAPERIKQLDMGMYERIAAHDAAGVIHLRETTGQTVCGYRAIALLLEMLPASATTYLMDYTTSGALGGNYRESVSYLSILIANEQPLAEAAADSNTGNRRHPD